MTHERYDSPIPSPTKYAISCFGKILMVNLLVGVFVLNVPGIEGLLIGSVTSLAVSVYFIFEEVQSYLRDSLYPSDDRPESEYDEATSG